MHRFVPFLILLWLTCGCESRSALRDEPDFESKKATLQAAFCKLDLSEWKAVSQSGFVSSDIATRALRPAVLAAQKQICACLQHWSGAPTTLKFRLAGYPSDGRTTVELETESDAEKALSDCVGSLEAKYPAFDFRGDLLSCSPQPCEPTAKPASFVYPLKVILE